MENLGELARQGGRKSARSGTERMNKIIKSEKFLRHRGRDKLKEEDRRLVWSE